MEICQSGMFWCAFELVFGIGAAVIALIFLAAGLGIEFPDKKEGK